MQMTADEMRSSDWSSDVCSSDLLGLGVGGVHAQAKPGAGRAPAKAREGAPNIIFIMTADQAQGALSAYGNKILKTPNMDRIGNEGIRFNKRFVPTSVCARSEERLVGKECVSTGRSRWSPSFRTTKKK